MGKPVVKEAGTPAEGTMAPADSGTQTSTTGAQTIQEESTEKGTEE